MREEQAKASAAAVQARGARLLRRNRAANMHPLMELTELRMGRGETEAQMR